jgi:PE family
VFSGRRQWDGSIVSFVFATPEALTAAASNITDIGSALSTANAAALAPITAPLAAAADQVSAAVSAVLSEHGQTYHAISAQFATFHDQFLQALSGAGSSYASAEAANAKPLDAG